MKLILAAALCCLAPNLFADSALNPYQDIRDTLDRTSGEIIEANRLEKLSNESYLDLLFGLSSLLVDVDAVEGADDDDTYYESCETLLADYCKFGQLWESSTTQETFSKAFEYQNFLRTLEEQFVGICPIEAWTTSVQRAISRPDATQTWVNWGC